MDKKSSQQSATWRRPSSKSKKRKFHGVLPHQSEADTSHASASAAKLKKSDDTSFDVHIDPTAGYSIIQFLLVFSALQQYVKCKVCNKDVSFTKYGQRGLGFKICVTCDCEEKYINSCPLISTGYEINRRLVYVMRLIGVGFSGINTFCGLMELGHGINSTVYYQILNSIAIAVQSVFDIVTSKSVKEEKLLNAQHGEPEDVLTVSGDGSWQKRGFSSLIGIVSLIYKYSKKIANVVVKSSHCKSCESKKGMEHTIEYAQWYEKHKLVCSANHSGSSGKMEVDGICEMFLQSLEKFAVHYGFYIGDGDTKTFKILLDTAPYGEDFVVKKLECVLHVAKRIFKRAKDAKKILTQKRKAAKKDAKEPSPKKKAAKKVVVKKKKVVIKKVPVVKTQDLSIKLMKELSTNYSLAIRRNLNSVEDMRREIWAGYYHKISTDSNPQHTYCSDSWCKYKKAVKNNQIETFKHPPALADDVQEVLKPIYEELTKDELLERCLGGNTQNNNECFNSCVWAMAPKHVFTGKKTVEIACQTAACIYNEGLQPVLKILEVMGVKLGPIAVQYAEKRDSDRIRVGNRRSSNASKETRSRRRGAILDEHTFYEESEGPLYGAGIAD